MAYIDGFVLAVPTANKDAYKKLNEDWKDFFFSLGITRMVECWGDDVPDGEVTSFPMAVQAKPDETVVFSWIEWPSKEVRDEGNKKMMEAPEFAEISSKMPFDGKRMIFGGFEVLMDD